MEWRNLILLLPAWFALPAHAETVRPAPAAPLSCQAASETYDQSLTTFAAVIPKSSSRLQSPSQEGDGLSPKELLATASKQLQEADRRSGSQSVDFAVALVNVAVASRDAGLYVEALAAVNEAEAILVRVAEGSDILGDALRERGIILSRLRRHDEALATFDKVIAIYEAKLGASADKVALAYRTKADILRGLNRFSDALLSLGRARAAYERRQPERAGDLAEVLIDTSIIHSRLNRPQMALSLANEAVAIASGALGPANRISARALHNVAIALRRLERYDEALAAFAHAFVLYIAPGKDSSIRAAEVLEDGAVTFGRIKCFERAIELQRQARQLYQDYYGTAHDRIAGAEHRLGLLMRDMGRREDALTAFASSAAIYDGLLGPENPRTALVYTDMAALYSAMGRSEEAIAYGIATVRILSRGGGPDKLRESLWSLARILKVQGNIPGAILFAKKAVNKQQEIRAANRELSPELAAALAERYRELYLFLADLLIEQGRLEEAQRVLDLIKQQEIIDFVRGGRPQLTTLDGRAPLTRTEQEASSDLDSLLKRPIALSKDLEALLARSRTEQLSEAEKARLAALKRQFGENYRRFQNELKDVIIGLSAQSAEAQGELVKLHLEMLGQARKRLRQFGDRAVLLQIASLEETVELFLTTGHAQVHHSEPISRQRMARLAFDAWSAVAHRQPDADAKLKILYDILIRPLESELKASGAEVIMLNLEGFLRYIPFAALTDGSHYLVEDYALTLQTPAADTTYVKGERDRTRAAGFGVTDGYREFSGLPAVASELELIFDGADDSGVFRGMPQLNAAFTVDGFATALEERPLFVHIASHFKLTPGDEAESYLLLGNGATLSLETIRSDARFQFTDVDLLTLSACETAGEVGTDGKEVESFATLAQGSGASSVLATLWPIADQATAKLMGDFYVNLLTGGLDKATALQKAQIHMIRAGTGVALALNTKRGFTPSEEGDADRAPITPQSHPYHWSAFILMGNWL